MKMDLMSLHVLTSMLSTTTQMCATILVLFCVVNYFSLKPAGSLKIVLISLFYYFSLVVISFVAAIFLKNISGHMLVGVSSLIEASIIHLGYGVLVLALYFRILVSKA
jgi:hypothetical protein